MPASNPSGTSPRRARLCGTRAVDEALSGWMTADTDRAALLEWIGQMVADGLAEWSLLTEGAVRVRLVSGEVFLFTANGMPRLA